MSIKAGDRIPALSLKTPTADGSRDIDTAETFAGRKVVLFAVPAAFSPTCSAQHLPGFIQQAQALKAAGVDLIACLAVNDAFVMRAWAGAQSVGDDIMMLADGSGVFTRALGLELDLTARGMGIRSQRYAMVIDDNVVASLAIEKPGEFQVSSAEHVLAGLTSK